MDGIVNPDLGRVLIEQLILFITRDTGSYSSSSASSKEHTPEVQAELDIVYKAADAQKKWKMKIKKGTNFIRGFFLWLFLWIRENSRTKMADLNLPFDNLVEVGFVKEIWVDRSFFVRTLEP